MHIKSTLPTFSVLMYHEVFSIAKHKRLERHAPSASYKYDAYNSFASENALNYARSAFCVYARNSIMNTIADMKYFTPMPRNRAFKIPVYCIVKLLRKWSGARFRRPQLVLAIYEIATVCHAVGSVVYGLNKQFNGFTFVSSVG